VQVGLSEAVIEWVRHGFGISILTLGGRRLRAQGSVMTAHWGNGALLWPGSRWFVASQAVSGASFC